MRFPHLAHRSAAAHKLHSTPQQDGINLISGNGETSSRLPAFSLFSPEAVQTTGTVADITWDDANLDKFLANPTGDVHGTKMFVNLPSESDRQNVISYLETLKK